MTFKEHMESRHGQIVEVYVKEFCEYVPEKEGRWAFSGILGVYEDFVTITSVEGDETAIRMSEIVSMDWLEDNQTGWIDEL